jgi:hypothetical protein
VNADATASASSSGTASHASPLFRALATARFAQADAEPAEVRPRLWLGSVGAAENVAGLAAKQVASSSRWTLNR